MQQWECSSEMEQPRGTARAYVGYEKSAASTTKYYVFWHIRKGIIHGKGRFVLILTWVGHLYSYLTPRYRSALNNRI